MSIAEKFIIASLQVEIDAYKEAIGLMDKKLSEYRATFNALTQRLTPETIELIRDLNPDSQANTSCAGFTIITSHINNSAVMRLDRDNLLLKGENEVLKKRISELEDEVTDLLQEAKGEGEARREITKKYDEMSVVLAKFRDVQALIKDKVPNTPKTPKQDELDSVKAELAVTKTKLQASQNFLKGLIEKVEKCSNLDI